MGVNYDFRHGQVLDDGRILHQRFEWNGAGWTPKETWWEIPPSAESINALREQAEKRDMRWLLHGAVGLLRWWLKLGRVESELAESRLRVCQQCDDYRDGIRCKVCGCGFRAKVTDSKEHCPIGKW